MQDDPEVSRRACASTRSTCTSRSASCLLALMLFRLGWRIAHPAAAAAADAALAGGARARDARRALRRADRACRSPATWDRCGAAIRSSGSASRCRRGAARAIALKDAMSDVHLVTSFVLLALRRCCTSRARFKHALRGDGLLARMGFGARCAASTRAVARYAGVRTRVRAPARARSTVGACLYSRAMSSARLAAIVDAGRRARRRRAARARCRSCRSRPPTSAPSGRCGRRRSDRRRWRAAAARSPCGLRRRHRSSRSCRAGRPRATSAPVASSACTSSTLPGVRRRHQRRDAVDRRLG